MQYLLLLSEIAVMAFFIALRMRSFKAVKRRINPQNFPEDSHNMVKTGKTKRIQAERVKYNNTMVILFTVALALVTFTLLFNASAVVDQHREDGLINEVFVPEEFKKS
jgi:amino acid transporter